MGSKTLGVWVGASPRQGRVCASSMTKKGSTDLQELQRVNYALSVVLLVMWLLQNFYMWTAGLVCSGSEH